MAELWYPIPVPEICERMIGFSVPRDNQVLVISYEGMHLLHLGHPITVESDDEYAEYELYDSNTGVCRYRGKEWDIIGMYPGRPVLTTRDGGQLMLDVVSRMLSVVVGGRPTWFSHFDNFSGDWAAATFSTDGRFIVLGCPYDFDFRVWERGADRSS